MLECCLLHVKILSSFYKKNTGIGFNINIEIIIISKLVRKSPLKIAEHSYLGSNLSESAFNYFNKCLVNRRQLLID